MSSDSRQIIETIAHLKFIGQIQSGQKISITSMQYQERSLWTVFMRTINFRDNREDVYMFIERSISNAYKFIELLGKSDSVVDQRRLNSITELLTVEVIDGLTCMCETYKDDILYTCKLEALIEDINSNACAFPETARELEQLP